MPQHQRLNQWIEELKTLCEPDAVVICDGSKSEYDQMMGKLVDADGAKPLNASLRPNSFLVRSDPADVARVESRTFIAARMKPTRDTNHWADPSEMRATLNGLFKDACAAERCTSSHLVWVQSDRRLPILVGYRLTLCCGQHACHDRVGQAVLD